MWTILISLLTTCFASQASLLHQHLLVEPCAHPVGSVPTLSAVAASARKRLLSELHAAKLENAVVFMKGGNVEHREDTDTEIHFRQESNFLYVTQVDQPDFAVVIDAHASKTYLLAPVRDANYALWNGQLESHEQLRKRYGVDDVRAFDDEHVDKLLRQLTPDNQTVFMLPWQHFEHEKQFNVDRDRLLPVVHAARVQKSDEEIAICF